MASMPFPSYDLVVAAHNGDQGAAERLVRESLPLVYTVVARAASPCVDVPELVARTMALVAAGMPGLAEPGMFRPWLCGTAMRFLWAAEQDESSGGRHADTPASLLGANTGAGSDQRAEAGEAVRWISNDDRELLSLWWLEVAGELSRDDVVAAGGLTPAQATTRIRQVEARFEDARTAVRALAAVPACPALTAVLARWDRRPSERRRREVVRHAQDCPACLTWTGDLIPADRLLRGTPLLVPPPAVVDRVWAAMRASGTAGFAARVPSGRGGAARRLVDWVRRVAAVRCVQTVTRITVVGVAILLLISALLSYAHSREAESGDPAGAAPARAPRALLTKTGRQALLDDHRHPRVRAGGVEAADSAGLRGVQDLGGTTA